MSPDGEQGDMQGHSESGGSKKGEIRKGKGDSRETQEEKARKENPCELGNVDGIVPSGAPSGIYETRRVSECPAGVVWAACVVQERSRKGICGETSEKLERLSRVGCGIGNENIHKQGMVRRVYT